MDLKRLRRGLDKKITERKHQARQIVIEKAELAASEARLSAATSAQQHLQQLAQEIQTKAHQQIARIVSKCLTTVFDDPYELRIEFVQLRGKTEAKLMYFRGGHEINPLLTSGGVLDISALALRCANMVLSNPPLRKLLVLDEPFTGVSAMNMPKVCALLEGLCEELQMQLLIVTHSEALKIGKVIQL